MIFMNNDPTDKSCHDKFLEVAQLAGGIQTTADEAITLKALKRAADQIVREKWSHPLQEVRSMLWPWD
jgi:hypothetical protein